MIFKVLDKLVEERCNEKFGTYSFFSPHSMLERLTLVNKNPEIFGLKEEHILFIFRHDDGKFELFIYFNKDDKFTSWTSHQVRYTKKLDHLMKNLKPKYKFKGKIEDEFPF